MCVFFFFLSILLLLLLLTWGLYINYKALWTMFREELAFLEGIFLFFWFQERHCNLRILLSGRRTRMCMP
jgi:hypothetical protein